MSGEVFGRLTVIGINTCMIKKVYWECVCECGNRCTVCGTKLRSGHTNSCGCLRNDKAKDLTGKTFGMLTVVSREGKYMKGITWNCKCECGNMKVIRGALLTDGTYKSCGCLSVKNRFQKKSTHRPPRTRLEMILIYMKSRCYRPKDPNYRHWGGRGIRICDEWLDNRSSFYEWAMRNGYSDELSIDRINVNGNYEPSNCRWANSFEQMRNTRRSLGVEKVIKIKRLLSEKNLSLKEIGELFGVKKTTVYKIAIGKHYKDI